MNNSQTTIATQTLTGRVAQILNARELVINIGSNQGVEVGMIFAVMAEEPVEVRDPNTEEVLDVLDREKVRVRVAEVRPKITICRTFRVTKVPAGPLYSQRMVNDPRGGFASAFGLGQPAWMFEPPREVPETLQASKESLPTPLSEEESYVKINDLVVRVAG